MFPTQPILRSTSFVIGKLARRLRVESDYSILKVAKRGRNLRRRQITRIRKESAYSIPAAIAPAPTENATEMPIGGRVFGRLKIR